MTRRTHRDPRWSRLEAEERRVVEQREKLLPSGDPQSEVFWRAVWGVK